MVFYTYLNTVQLSNSVSNINEKKYKAGTKRLMSDKVLKPFVVGVLSFSFYENYTAAVHPEKSGQDLQRSINFLIFE
jgi:hypothetical protein